MQIPASVPHLAAPGAGLPWWERLVTRYVVLPLVFPRLTWPSASAMFQLEGSKIIRLWESTPAEQLEQRVLIKRISGIEDSSRYWSVAMTVEHLNIVGCAIRAMIEELRQGKIPDRRARIEDVKPSGEKASVAIKDEFLSLLQTAEEGAATEKPLRRGEGPKSAHPWFGPLDAFQWHCLLAFHQGIHRKQIEAIRKKLKAK